MASDKPLVCPKCWRWYSLRETHCGVCRIPLIHHDFHHRVPSTAPSPGPGPAPAQPVPIGTPGTSTPVTGPPPPSQAAPPNVAYTQSPMTPPGYPQQPYASLPAYAPVGMHYAGFWIRFVANLIDWVILSIVFIPLSHLFGAGILSVLYLIVGVGYFAGLWTTGCTVGQRALGLRVVDASSGQSIAFVRALIRYVGIIISEFPLALGLIWAGFDARKQGWHDKIAGTVVVRARAVAQPYPPVAPAPPVPPPLMQVPGAPPPQGLQPIPQPIPQSSPQPPPVMAPGYAQQPYMAPPVFAPVGPRYAGFWIRFVANLIDWVILSIVFIPLSHVFGAGILGVLYLIVGVGYFAGLWTTGCTVGQRALGLRVVDASSGQSIAFVRALIRYVGIIISEFPLALGLIWARFDARKQGWHDKIAGTVVVRVR